MSCPPSIVAPEATITRRPLPEAGLRSLRDQAATVRPHRLHLGDLDRDRLLPSSRMTETEERQEPHRDACYHHEDARVEGDRRHCPPAVRIQQDRAEGLTLEQGVG